MPFAKVYLLFTIHTMVLVTSVYNVGGFPAAHPVRTHDVVRINNGLFMQFQELPNCRQIV